MAKRDRDNAESESGTDVDMTEGDTAPETVVETAEQADIDGLVKMHKGGESLHVHPTTVEAHKEKGWTIA